tara:strand:+ start:20302 stop:21282 length:981 start_codon:yes stop_codon:yes gene_type:complete
MKRMMIVDAHNQFLRSYIVDPSVSSNGFPIGGVKGFMKILNKLTREIKPDKIVVVWDGEGGSKKRKAKNKNYKAGRTPPRLNRGVNNLTQQEEAENRQWQQLKAFEYLNNTPIVQFREPYVEADDVIAYVAKHQRYTDWQKVIVSSDKDFIQVLDDKTILYRPTQSQILNTKRVVDEYGIHPANFVLARAMAGDKSDNLDGVSGVGIKTASKRFPFLREENEYYLTDIYSHCEKNVDSRLKVYRNILESKDTVDLNYDIMQLSSPSLSAQTKERVISILDEWQPEFNKTNFRAMLIKDGFGEINLDNLFEVFNKICFNIDKCLEIF